MSAGEKQTGARDSAIWDLFLLVLLTAVACLPLLLAPGLVNTRAGGDSPFLLVRVQQLVTMLQAKAISAAGSGYGVWHGVLPVRWMPDAAYGLGYPFFNYYAPLPFYIAAAFRFAGLGFIGAVKATQVLGFLTAAAGMFLLARRLLGSRSAALLVSLAYTYAPFHLVNVYVRGDSLGEFYAFAFYPLIVLALQRLRERRSLNDVVFLALAYAGLVLSHNLSALIFSPFILAHILFLALCGTATDPQPPLTRQTSLACLRQAVRWTVVPTPKSAAGSGFGFGLPLAGLVLGMSLSAWYWGPALLERGAVQLERNLTGYFHYAGHFRRLDLVQMNFLFDYSLTGQRTPFAMGLFQTLLTLLAILAMVSHSVRRRYRPQSPVQQPPSSLDSSRAKLVWPIAVYWLLATVLITPLSRPIWDHLPLLPFVQFPWRFLSVQSFFGSLLIGYLATLCRRMQAKEMVHWLVKRAETFADRYPMFTYINVILSGASSLCRHQGRLFAALRVTELTLRVKAGRRISLATRKYLRSQSRTAEPSQAKQVWHGGRMVAYALALLLLITAMANLRVEYLAITDADVTSDRLTLYELFTANIGSTVRAEYLPQGVEPRPYSSAVLLNGGRKPPPLVIAGQVERAELLVQAPAEERWRITVSSPEAEIAFYTLHFPGWRGYVDGQRVQISPVRGSGLISMRLPQGQHEVVLRFWFTRRRAPAEAVSLLAGILLIGMMVWSSRRRWAGRTRSGMLQTWTCDETRGLLVLTAIAFLLSAAVLWLYSRVSPPPSPLTMDFARMPYLHANPTGVRFGDDLRLVGYDYADRVPAGQRLVITLRWEGDAPGSRNLQAGLQAEVSLVSPAVHLFGVPDVLASQTVPLETVTVHQLDVPADLMPGPYLILLRVHGEGGELVPRNEAGERLGTTYLRPVYLDPPAEPGPAAGPEPGAALGQFGEAIRLTALSTEQIAPNWLRVDMTWWAARDIPINYKTSVRLKDEAGQTLVQVDRQPLYGFYPTTAWRRGQTVFDRRWLDLPANIAPGDGYRIEVVVYEVPSLQALGTAEVSGVAIRARVQ